MATTALLLLMPAGAQQAASDAEAQSAEENVSFRNFTPFLQAVWDQDLEQVKQLILQGADPNQVDDLGRSAVHLLAEHDNAVMILDLANLSAELGAIAAIDVDIADNDGLTAAQLAAQLGHRSSLRSLNIAKADMWRLTPEGLSMLELALINNHQDVAQYLVVQNIGLGEVGPDGTPATMRLVNAELPSWAWELIAQVATARDVNKPDSGGATPLHHAARTDRTNVITSLILAGANPNAKDARGNSPIHYAVQANQPEAIRILVDGGADPNIRSSTGDTPIFTSAFLGNVQSLSALIEMGADPHITNSDGLHPLHAAASGSKDAHGVWLLLEYDTNINIQSKDGLTPLHMAAISGNVPAAKALLLSGAEPGIADNSGQTPIYPAILNETDDMLKLLLENGASVNHIALNGQTPIQLARQVGKNKLAVDLFMLRVLPGY